MILMTDAEYRQRRKDLNIIRAMALRTGYQVDDIWKTLTFVKMARKSLWQRRRRARVYSLLLVEIAVLAALLLLVSVR